VCLHALLEEKHTIFNNIRDIPRELDKQILLKLIQKVGLLNRIESKLHIFKADYRSLRHFSHLERFILQELIKTIDQRHQSSCLSF